MTAFINIIFRLFPLKNFENRVTENLNKKSEEIHVYIML